MKADPATEAEILKIMNRMLNAFANWNDLDAYMKNIFFRTPICFPFRTVHAGERYVGFDEIRSFYKQMVDQADPNFTNILIELGLTQSYQKTETLPGLLQVSKRNSKWKAIKLIFTAETRLFF